MANTSGHTRFRKGIGTAYDFIYRPMTL